jgi:hypothetical protein
MNKQLSSSLQRRPTSAKIIAIVNGIAFAVTLLFWGLAFFGNLIPYPGGLTILSERANAATTYGFMIGDIIWSAPLLLLGTIGIWRLRPWGWTSAQMVNVLWVYSMTVIWMRDAFTTLSPGGMLFLPFTVFAVWATYSLWKTRAIFWSPNADDVKT